MQTNFSYIQWVRTNRIQLLTNTVFRLVLFLHAFYDMLCHTQQNFFKKRVVMFFFLLQKKKLFHLKTFTIHKM